MIGELAGTIASSIEIVYGNEILRIGFACQLLGLIFSVGEPNGLIDTTKFSIINITNCCFKF